MTDTNQQVEVVLREGVFILQSTITVVLAMTIPLLGRQAATAVCLSLWPGACHMASLQPPDSGPILAVQAAGFCCETPEHA
jgi:hypothetical protein